MLGICARNGCGRMKDNRVYDGLTIMEIINAKFVLYIVNKLKKKEMKEVKE